MRDHRYDMTEEERAAHERELRNITAPMRRSGPRFQATPNRAARRIKRKQQAASRRRNR